MVRSHEGSSCPWQVDLYHFDRSLVVDVVEMEHREHAWIRTAAAQMRAQIDALQTRADDPGGEPAHPLIEIAKHDLRDADPAIVNDAAQSSRLIPSLEKRGTKMHVVEMQCLVAQGDVHALTASRLARLP